MNDIKFDKVEVNVLSEGSRRLEFDLVNWNGKIKYDIRRWNNDGTIPYKGLTIEEHELSKLLEVLKFSIISPKGDNIIHTYEFNNVKAKMYENFGIISETKNWNCLLTLMDWGSGKKYDIRNWSKDFSKCGKGVIFNDEEANKLIHVLENKANKSPTNAKVFDDIKDDLLI